MCEQVTRNRADLRIDVLPGVPELLQHLRAQGKILGVATGNLAEIGRTKLAHCRPARLLPLRRLQRRL